MQKNLKTKKNKKKDNISESLKFYAKYSGLAFQTGAIIFAGTLGGYKLDEYFGFEKKILTLIFSVLSVFIAIYFAVKDFIKKK